MIRQPCFLGGGGGILFFYIPLCICGERGIFLTHVKNKTTTVDIRMPPTRWCGWPIRRRVPCGGLIPLYLPVAKVGGECISIFFNIFNFIILLVLLVVYLTHQLNHGN